MKDINAPIEVKNAEVIFVNHSGGKDSQAMLAAIHRQGFTGKVVIVHSDLGEMEWEPMHNFIEKNSFGYEINVIKPELDFFQLCEKYNRLPSGMARFCTSELKTSPIGKFIRNYCAENNIKVAINAIGVRAEESPSRAKKKPFKLSDQNRKTLDTVIYEWLPIFDYKLIDVKIEIENAGQSMHKVYSKGFSRLSCVFCVFGRIGEHQLAAKERPELFGKMVELERKLGKSIRLKQIDGKKYPKFLTEYITQ